MTDNNSTKNLQHLYNRIANMLFVTMTTSLLDNYKFAPENIKGLEDTLRHCVFKIGENLNRENTLDQATLKEIRSKSFQRDMVHVLNDTEQKFYSILPMTLFNWRTDIVENYSVLEIHFTWGYQGDVINYKTWRINLSLSVI